MGFATLFSLTPKAIETVLPRQIPGTWTTVVPEKRIHRNPRQNSSKVLSSLKQGSPRFPPLNVKAPKGSLLQIGPKAV